MKFRWILLLVLLLGIVNITKSQNNDFSILKGHLGYTDIENSMYHYFLDQAEACWKVRETEIASLKTKQDWQQRQDKVKELLQDIIGPFPQKTPLNSKVLGVLKKQNYRIEKIVYESMPGNYVTACMFIPNNRDGKTPAVIYCSGHSSNAFRSATYQRVILNLVEKGFIVLAFDPVGQGERLQYFDPSLGESLIGGPTLEHSYPGAQCFIAGRSLARYMIWDGIRTVDYLLSRKEVDPKRIGITGRSGGGTQSSYIAAFDDRIFAAAPECFITSLRRLWQTRGPQDAEQNFYAGISRGIDHADLLLAHAPKPALMITTTRDFFSIQGARETASEVRRGYQAFDADDNFMMVEDDNVHASTKKNREAMYAFFQKYLNLPGSSQDDDVTLLTDKELRVTSTGQVSTSLGGETIFSLNKKETAVQLADLENARNNNAAFLKDVRSRLGKLLEIPKDFKSLPVCFAGRYNRDDYSVEMFYTNGQGNYQIPFLLFVPKKNNRQEIILYLDPKGKGDQAVPEKDIDKLVKQGFTVLAPDLLGYGETGPGEQCGDSYNFKIGKISYNKWFTPICLGKSITGVQAADILQLVHYLKLNDQYKEYNISAVAKDDLCTALLHAAVFEESIQRIALVNGYVSFASIVENRFYKPNFIPTTVPKALEFYDLPDLVALLAPRQLLYVNAIDHLGHRADSENVNKILEFAKKAYIEKTADDDLQIKQLQAYENEYEVLSGWLLNK